VNGYLEAKGVKRGGKVSDAPTRADIDALFAQFDEQGRPRKDAG